MAVWLTILRSKMGGVRLMMALDASDFAIKVSEAGITCALPGCVSSRGVPASGRIENTEGAHAQSLRLAS
jgi:hypothetical protein